MRGWLRRGTGMVALVALLGFALPGAPAAAQPSGNVVVNGSFESPVVTIGNTEFFSASDASSTGLTGWTVASGSVDLNTSVVWQAADGNQSLDLSGNSAGAIYQDVPTIPGQTYTLQFAMAGNPFCSPSMKQMQVSWNGTTLPTVSFSITGKSASDMGYVEHAYAVSATAASTRLEFTSLTQSSCGPVLDAVSVTPVTFASVCALASYYEAQPGIANSLCAKLDAAGADAARGNTHAQDGVLGAFQHEVAAQTGKTLTAGQAALLTQEAETLMS